MKCEIHEIQERNEAGKLVVREFVEFDEYRFGLGLLEETTLPQVRRLSDAISLSFNKIREITESQDFIGGRKLFDSTWITNQNGYGSCASYAAASALEKARYRMGQRPRIKLSGDYLYSLVNGGRDRGSLLSDNLLAIKQRGVCSAATVPLGGIYRSKYDRSIADAEARRFRAHEPYAIKTEQEMATALACGWDVVIAIHVGRGWRNFDSDDFLAPARGRGNHSEHCDDIYYDRKRGCFAYRKATSHGKRYSDDGYCWTTWDDHYATTAKYHQFYAVPSAIMDPLGDLPPLVNGDDDPQPSTDKTITMESRGNCGLCVDWKRDELPKAKREGWQVIINDRASGGVPRFAVEANGRTADRVGFATFEELSSLVV